MNILIYVTVVLLATTVGAATGMGGGVIIKPALDVLGDYSAEAIGALSSCAVLAMSLVSVAKHVRAKTKLSWALAAQLAAGSIVGGYTGNFALGCSASSLQDNHVKVMQNAILAAVLLISIIYMWRKEKVRTLHMAGSLWGIGTGFVLGTLSSFLGIGGGPINVAALTYLFSLPTGTAAVYSLITILAAQISKMATILLTEDVALLSTPVLPAIVASAIAGGYIGSHLNRHLPRRVLDILFNAVQVVVFLICSYNISVNYTIK